jgi:glyoxylate/hydroxypyruvate reductase
MQIFVYPALSELLRNRLRSGASVFGEVVFNAENPGKGEHLITNADILLGNPPRVWLKNVAGRLKFWQLDSAGFNQYADIDTPAAVCNMGDYFSVPCAETMVGGILSFYRLIPQLAKLQLQKRWVGAPLRPGMDVLTGKRVLILGAGSIGKAIAIMLGGFNCRITFAARTARGSDVIALADAGQTIASSDIIINTLPGNADKVVTGSFFDQVREGALYASIGRGNTTDEPALIAALRPGKLAGAVLDVTMEEPLPSDHVFWEMSNVILTQHTGGGQQNEDAGKVDLFLANLERFAKKMPLLHEVDLGKGY